MLRRKKHSIAFFLLTVVLATLPRSLTHPLVAQSAKAQTAEQNSFPFIEKVPTGTVVRIDGSESMAVLNQTLKQRFEQQYDGTTVELADRGTDVAIQALVDGTIDLAAIGRPLTDEERAQGLIEAPVSREKIAIFVGAENPFKGNLTFEQFARIFRGEIVNWSELGDAAGPIRLIDRPDNSDTRQALSRYSVFQTAPFQTGPNATRLSEDSTAAMIEQLGQEGIGYAIVGQVQDRNDVRIIPMHETLPDDLRYPYSQPRNYVYREASPVVQAFLGFVTSPVGQQAVVEARSTEATAAPALPISPSPTAEATAIPSTSPNLTAEPPSASPAQSSPMLSPSPTVSGSPVPEAASTQASNQDVSWLPWLLLPLAGVGGLLLWGLNRRRGTVASSEQVAAPISNVATDATGITLAARTGSVVAGDRSTLPERQVNLEEPANLGAAGAEILSPPIPSELPPTIAEPTAPRSESLPSTTSVSPIAASSILAAGAGTAALAGIIGSNREERSRIVLTPRTVDQGYAYWEVPDAEKSRLKQQGGEHFTLKIAGVTGIEPATDSPAYVQHYACTETDQDAFVALPVANREYVAEIGYLTADQNWLSLARSVPVYVASAAGAAISREQPALSEVGMVQASDPLATELQFDPVQENPEQAIETGALAAEAESISIGSEPETIAKGETILHRPEASAEAGSEVEGSEIEIAPQQPESDPDLETPAQRPEENDPAATADANTVSALLIGGTALAAGIGALDSPTDAAATQSAVEATRFELGSSDEDTSLAAVDEGLPELPNAYEGSWITLLPKDPYWAYAYWNTPEDHKQALRQQGGQRLALRFYDVTGIDLREQNPHSLQQYECDEIARDWSLPVPVSDRDYIVEIGYVTSDGRWLMLARSNAVRTPPLQQSEWHEEQFLTVSWDEALSQRSLVELSLPEQRFGYPIPESGFGVAHSTQLSHVAGSLFGFMHQIPPASVSSFAMASGAGLISRTESGAGMMSGVGMTSGVGMMSGMGMFSMSGVGMAFIGVPTLSGIGMGSGVGMSGMSGIGMFSMSGVGMSGPMLPTLSGIGMGSGIGMMGMSGIGMFSMSGVGFASMPPIRSRQFWLLADAALIIYGATEPGATVTIAGQPVPLNPDGTFRFHLSFQDGQLDFPILAVAEDGVQSRSIHLRFSRETPNRDTNSKAEAQDEFF